MLIVLGLILRIDFSGGGRNYIQNCTVRLSTGKPKHTRHTHCVKVSVNRLVAKAFISNPNNYKYINHIDSDKTNNSLENLEWCTNSENVKHGWHSGNRTHKNNTSVYVSDSDGNYIGNYTSIRKCAEALKLDRHKIARILKGELAADYLGYLFSYFAPV